VLAKLTSCGEFRRISALGWRWQIAGCGGSKILFLSFFFFVVRLGSTSAAVHGQDERRVHRDDGRRTTSAATSRPPRPRTRRTPDHDVRGPSPSPNIGSQGRRGHGLLGFALKNTGGR